VSFFDWRDRQYRDLRQMTADAREQRTATRGHVYALEIPFSVIVGCVLGTLVDEHFGVAPWGFAGGLAAGIGAAVRSIARLIRWQRAVDAAETTESAEPAAASRGPDAP
jgi:F0F1-type ATP synthase assembly protein I